MAATLEELEARLAALEAEVARLKERSPQPAAATAPASRLPPSMVADQAVISTAVARAFAALGITGTPIGAEKVQEMIAACGVKPEDNEFSRGIIEMREE